MNYIEEAILDYVYSRIFTDKDKDFEKQVEDGIKRRVVDGDWKYFRIDIPNINAHINNLEKEYTECTQEEFIKKIKEQ